MLKKTQRLVNFSTIAFVFVMLFALSVETFADAKSYVRQYSHTEKKNYIVTVSSVQKEDKIKEKSSYLSEEVAEETVTKEPDESLTKGIIVAPKMTAKKVNVVEVSEPSNFQGNNEINSSWSGPKLTASKGVNNGPTGKETYYNLPMSGVVSIMRQHGFSESEYPYWVRSDGVKMLGKYVMVAANLNRFPRGSFVESSLGKALVCDTGDFASSNPTQLDIAVTW